MPVLSRVAAPAATHDLADVVLTLFSHTEHAVPRDVPGPVEDQPPGDENQLTVPVAGRSVTGPPGLGTSTAHIPWRYTTLGETIAATDPGIGLNAPDNPARSGTSAMRVSTGPPADGGPTPELSCPPALRDDQAHGAQEINDHLVSGAGQLGIYPGQLARVRAGNLGPLMMLTHPATDDPDQLATTYVLAQWATDEHFLDEQSLRAEARVIDSRRATTHTAVDPADLSVRDTAQPGQALPDEPVTLPYHSAFNHRARHATTTQTAQLRHALTITAMTDNHEANWHTTGRIPPVREDPTHRHKNSFLPPIVLVDPTASYELFCSESTDRQACRMLCLTGKTSAILNNPHPMTKEPDTNVDPPQVTATEKKNSPQKTIERTTQTHNELMHTFVEEAAILSNPDPLTLRRSLTNIRS